MKRIALIVPDLMIGAGVPSVARFIHQTIIESGQYRCKLISLATSADDRCSRLLREPRTWWGRAEYDRGEWEGAEFIHVGANWADLEWQRYRKRKSLDNLVADCDLLQIVCGSPAWGNSICGLGKPISIQCATRAKVERRRRDADPYDSIDWWRFAMATITDQMDDRALRLADAIQVENKWMYEYVRELNEGREFDLRLAMPGVDVRRFFPAGERNFEDDCYVLCVGRLDDPRKNVNLLLDAYSLIPKDLVGRLRLVMAGHSGPPASFWERAEALGLRDKIEFVQRPDSGALVDLYQKAAMFVLCSDEEGLGIVLLEAMACGIPVVSTRSGGPDGLIIDGDNGFLVPRDDAVMLADRIVRLHRNAGLNRSMGKRARAAIEQRYASTIAGRAFLDIWDVLLHKAGNVCAE